MSVGATTTLVSLALPHGLLLGALSHDRELCAGPKVAAAPAAAAAAPAAVAKAAPAPAVEAAAKAAGTTVSELRGTTVPFTSLQAAVSRNMIESLKVGHPPALHKAPKPASMIAEHSLYHEGFLENISGDWPAIYKVNTGKQLFFAW